MTEENARDPRLCHAHNRRGRPCGRLAVPGRRVCHFHGGAPGSGAPPGNQNARRHGFDAATHPSGIRDSAEFREALNVQGLSGEIATLRVLVDRAVDASDQDLGTIAKGLEVLTRMVRAQYAMSQRSKDSLSDALADVLEKLGDQMGLRDALP